MNVFILDSNMMRSAQMLDDEHLKVQINDICEILMINYNNSNFSSGKIECPNNPIALFYRSYAGMSELLCYLELLLYEYEKRFKKRHQNYFWWLGFTNRFSYHLIYNFEYSKTYVNDVMTNDIEAIREYIKTSFLREEPTWTNREKPDWWEV